MIPRRIVKTDFKIAGYTRVSGTFDRDVLEYQLVTKRWNVVAEFSIGIKVFFLTILKLYKTRKQIRDATKKEWMNVLIISHPNNKENEFLLVMTIFNEVVFICPMLFEKETVI